MRGHWGAVADSLRAPAGAKGNLMRIQLQRDGQSFGPYALDELKRYIDEGRVIASDGARLGPDDAFQPVMTLLASLESSVDRPAAPARPAAAAQPPSARLNENVYAAPRAVLTDPPARSPDDAASLTEAGFWRRLAAYTIDILIIYMVIFAIGTVIGLIGVGAMSATDILGGGDAWVLVALYAAGIVAYWLYFTVQESSAAQATLGKRVMGLVVTDNVGRRISFGRASGRFFGAAINWIVMGIGYLLAALPPNKQGLHDLIASTRVRNRRQPPRPVWSAVLIALPLLLLPVIGMVAAVSIPAYSDYTARAQVSDGVNAAAIAKRSITEFYLSNSMVPADATEAGIAESDLQFSSGTIAIEDGAILLAFDGTDSRLDGQALALSPHLTADGDVAWTCGHALADESAQPLSSVDSAGATTLDWNLLPESCR